MLFNIIKTIHIFSVISWMAGLLYLPRIFVYHANPKILKETSETFKIMEKRLMLYIMNPAKVLSWIFGILLILEHGTELHSILWIQLKLVLVIFLTIYHDRRTMWMLPVRLWIASSQA